MFKIGKVINYYEKIGITIIALTGNLTLGDKIKVFKDGVLWKTINEITRIDTNMATTLIKM